MIILYIFSFLAGLCTVLSPCILPILPIVLAAGATKGKWRPFGVALGLIISFTFFTLALTSIVQTTGVSATILRNISIVILFLFGLVMIFPALSRWFFQLVSPIAAVGQRIQESSSQTGFGGGLILGFALGLIWTPCAGPILAAIIALIATHAVTWMTLCLLLAYVIGAAIPLFFIILGGGAIIRSSKFLTSHLEGIRQFFGLITILVALAIAFHWDVFLEQRIVAYVPSVLPENNSLVNQELQKVIKKEVMSVKDFSFEKAPELMGVTNWINSPPLSLHQLRGKVVLLDFWTYSCINCLRTLPYLEGWYKKYQDKGLVIIGIHTPEFEFEKNPDNVMEAVHRLGITYPVAQDNAYMVWNAYHNQFWPAHYLIDKHGNIVLTHFGEGGYAEMEEAIQHLLGISANLLPEARAETTRISPETYLGTKRGQSYTQENKIIPSQTMFYSYSSPLQEDQVGLRGYWKAQGECITSESNESFLDGNFLARNVYLVLSGPSQQPLEIFLDGKKVKEIKVNFAQKYDIVSTTYGWHLLSIKVPQGISAYAFTFGAEKKNGDL